MGRITTDPGSQAASRINAKDADGTYTELNRDDIAGNRTLFNELIVAERTPQIDLNSRFGLSVLRDTQTVANSGAIANSNGEHNLSTGVTTASTAQLTSVARGRYYPGTSALAGIGVRAPGSYTGTAYAEWGYFDANDGFGWGVDATGTYLFYTRGGAQTKVYSGSWSIDVMDGTGPSGQTLTLSDGNIFQISFSWYGYGQIEWYVVLTDATGKQVPCLVHRYAPTGTNSVQNPNLPINAYVDNGNTTTDYDLYVGGRQFSIKGRYIPAVRRTHERRLQRASVGTTFVPLITFRRKSGFEGFPVRFHQADLISNQDLVWEVRVNGSLTGASFGTPTNVSATETSLESDIAATAITGGELVEAGLLTTGGGGGGGPGGARGGFSLDTFVIDLPNTDEITLCVRTVTGTATVDAVMGMEEEW